MTQTGRQRPARNVDGGDANETGEGAAGSGRVAQPGPGATALTRTRADAADAAPDRAGLRGGVAGRHRATLAALGLLALTHIGFVSLGLPDGLLGVGWPSIRETFGVPLDALGALLVAVTTGYLASSWSSGPVVARIGIGRLLALSGLLTGVGLLGYALAPVWWVMVLLGVMVGLGGGAIDAGLNHYVAVHHSPRQLNWLHASYGLGAALGPLLMTGVLAAGHTWRGGYAIVGGVQLLLGAAFLATAARWRRGAASDRQLDPTSDADAPVPVAATLRRPLVWCGIALFFVYTGVEAAAGQWAFTLFHEGRGVPSAVAAGWVSAYYATFTAGRVLFGVVANRFPTAPLLRCVMLVGLAGAALVWRQPSLELSLFGLVLLGFAEAPVFPLLIAASPARYGARQAANVIGFQIGSAALGAALLPATVGLFAARTGLETIGLCVTLSAAAVFLLHEVLARGSG